MSWRVISIGDFLKVRKDRYKPIIANSLGLKRIEKIDFSGQYHLVEKSTNTDMILVRQGDLLISGINAEKGAITVYQEKEDALATIHYSSYVFDEEQIDIEYFRWFLKSDAFKNLLRATAGNGIKTELKPKHILPLKILLPDLNKQQRIVKEIINKNIKLDEVVNETNSQLSNIQLLRQAILQEAVQGKLVPQDPTDEPASELLKRIKAEKEKQAKKGKTEAYEPITDVLYEIPKGWVWCRLGEIINIMDSGWSPACLEYPAENNKWGVLKTTSVQPLLFLENENKELPDSLLPKTQYEVKAGDILITRAGPANRVGICCLVKETRSQLMISDKIIRFHPYENYIYADYIVLCLNIGESKSFIESKKSGMALSQVNISQENLKLTPLSLPPFNQQKRIVAKVAQLMKLCDELETQVQQSKADAEKLLQAVLREAFEGNKKYNTENAALSLAAEP